MARSGPSALPGEPRDITLADGRRLHVKVAGSGRPAVVFEAGMGSSLGAWSVVMPGVAERTTAVAYDRAGYGASDRGPEPRNRGRRPRLRRRLGDQHAHPASIPYSLDILRPALVAAAE